MGADRAAVAVADHHRPQGGFGDPGGVLGGREMVRAVGAGEDPDDVGQLVVGRSGDVGQRLWARAAASAVIRVRSWARGPGRGAPLQMRVLTPSRSRSGGVCGGRWATNE